MKHTSSQLVVVVVVVVLVVVVVGSSSSCSRTFTFSHLADAFIQSDVQRRKLKLMQQRPSVIINTIRLKELQECNYFKCELSTS